jgi:hypothetical protein
MLFKVCNFKNITHKTVGIHWFNGSSEAKKFQNDLENKLKDNNTTIATSINSFLEKIKDTKYDI